LIVPTGKTASRQFLDELHDEGGFSMVLAADNVQSPGTHERYFNIAAKLAERFGVHSADSDMSRYEFS
jgi:hypothetical protein